MGLGRDLVGGFQTGKFNFRDPGRAGGGGQRNMGHQPGLIHQRLAELYGPLDSAKADFHEKMVANARKRRVYRADIKSKLKDEPAKI